MREFWCFMFRTDSVVSVDRTGYINVNVNSNIQSSQDDGLDRLANCNLVKYQFRRWPIDFWCESWCTKNLSTVFTWRVVFWNTKAEIPHG